MELEDLRQLAGRLLAPGNGVAKPTEPKASGRHARRSEAVTYRIRIDLEHATPPIWRRLDVRSDIGLDTFHQILQAAFGWSDCHLHRFALGDSVFDRNAELFLCPYDVEEGEDDGVPANQVRLDECVTEPGDLLRYCYDYGDSWDLVIALEAIHPVDASSPAAVCVDGRRAAPPEDCGGLRDEADLADFLEDPTHFDPDEINQALVDPYLVLRDRGVNHELVDVLTRLRGTEVGDGLVTRLMILIQDRPVRTGVSERAAALHPLLWFLDRVGDDGLTLTSAGYLKPPDVAASATVIPDAASWIGTANREAHTFPVLEFRRSLQELGLLRKYRGRLLLTKAGTRAGGNPEELWRHLVGRLPSGKPGSVESHAGWVTLLLAASAPDAGVSFPDVAHALTQHGWRDGREPVSEYSARWAASGTLGVLHNLGTGPRSRSTHRKVSDVAADLAVDALLGRALPMQR